MRAGEVQQHTVSTCNRDHTHVGDDRGVGCSHSLPFETRDRR
ncbi:hypothetical protein GFS60_00309 [Rhodococcus sp. WAY2]|nr:hypothetical protein GFS60_00309 [Rhodococcus sp. WAY2]